LFDVRAAISKHRDEFRAGAGVPKLDDAIKTGRGKRAAVGTVREPGDRVGVALNGPNVSARSAIPDLDHAGGGRRGEHTAIGTEAQGVGHVALQAPNSRHRGGIPNHDVADEAPSGEPLTVRAIGEATHAPRMSGECSDLPSGGRLPDSNR